MPNQYRKKPIIIDAVQWNGHNLEEIKEFVGSALHYTIHDAAWQVGKGRVGVVMRITTLEGPMEVSLYDYVIKGIKGEFYPCKPGIFTATYEMVE